MNDQENLSSNECLVRVRAQVMARDDSSGGWVPVGGGGLSFVALRKVTRFISDDQPPSSQPVKTKSEFIVTGHKTTDDSICLNCIIKRELQYNQVTPTFRHWGINSKKFGLTFPSPADAKLFDAAVEKALEELRTYTPESSPKSGRGCSEVNSDPDSGSAEGEEFAKLARGKRLQPSLPLSTRRSASPQLSSLSVPSPAHSTRSSTQVLTAKRLSSLPTNMTKSLSSPLQTTQTKNTVATSVRLSSSTHIVETSTKELTSPLMPICQDPPSAEKYTYVDVIPSKKEEQNTMVRTHPDPPSGPHDYSYPSLESVGRSEKRDSISSIKIHNLDLMSSHRPPLLPIKNKRKRSRKREKKVQYSRGERVRCRYCHEFYSTDGNERGACEFAPDKIKDGINKITCIPALTGVLYRCSSDADGECTNPCSCDTSVRNCFGRWIVMAALSLILPCLCCYLPLRGCHKVGLACGICGGRHEAMDPR